MVLTDQIKKLLEEMRSLKAGVPEPEEDPIIIGRFGRQFEQSFFGFTLPDDVDLFFKPEEYLDFNQALEEMKRIQPEGYDPSNPSGGCNKEFFEAVKSFMRVDRDDLQYFISIGTKFDFWHGADAVFCWRGVAVTVDGTVDPEKQHKQGKANFLIRPEDVESGDAYISIARDIVHLLIRKYLYKYSTASRT